MRLTKQAIKELTVEAALLGAGVGGIALCHTRPVPLSVLLAATACVGFAFWRRSDVVWLYVLAAVVGPAAEIVGVKAGAWTYAEPTLLGIPLWLPFAWGLATMVIKGLADTIAQGRGDR